MKRKVSGVVNKNAENAVIVWVNLYHTGENTRKIEYGELKNK